MVIVDWLQVAGLVAGALTTIGIFSYSVYIYILTPVVNVIQSAAAIIERELTPNGGGSMFDRLNRMEANMNLHIQQSEVDSEKLHQHIEDSKAHRR